MTSTMGMCCFTFTTPKFEKSYRYRLSELGDPIKSEADKTNKPSSSTNLSTAFCSFTLIYPMFISLRRTECLIVSWLSLFFSFFWSDLDRCTTLLRNKERWQIPAGPENRAIEWNRERVASSSGTRGLNLISNRGSVMSLLVGGGLVGPIRYSAQVYSYPLKHWISEALGLATKEKKRKGWNEI